MKNKITLLQTQVDGLRDVLQKNIETMMANNERLQDLEYKSERLKDQARLFKHVTTKLGPWYKRPEFLYTVTVAAFTLAVAGIMVLLGALGVIPMSAAIAASLVLTNVIMGTGALYLANRPKP